MRAQKLRLEDRCNSVLLVFACVFNPTACMHAMQVVGKARCSREQG